MKSFYHLYHDALLRRFKGTDIDSLNFQTRINQLNAGIAGEKRVIQELEDSLRKGEYELIHGLQLLNEQGYPYQIDLLLMTSRFLLIIEVKNIAGTLLYDEVLRQFHRVRMDGKKDVFFNPFDQLYRQQENLYVLLQNINVRIPIVALVVNANNHSIFDSSMRGQPILHVGSLRSKLLKLRERYPPALSTKQLLRVKQFLESHKIFYEAHRYVARDSLQYGVLCPDCNYKKLMEYANRTWHCPGCMRRNRYALHLALRDYRILIGPKITNELFRQWTGLDNPYSASKILRRFQFPSSGNTRGRVYQIPQEFMFLED